jgi:hypothetical protein
VTPEERVLSELQVDLSDFSDEFVAGFVAGARAERDRVAERVQYLINHAAGVVHVDDLRQPLDELEEK